MWTDEPLCTAETPNGARRGAVPIAHHWIRLVGAHGKPIWMGHSGDHGLRVRVDERGAEIGGNGTGIPALRLALVAIGTTTGTRHPVGSATEVVDVGGRVELRRIWASDGPVVTEWYANTPLGTKQGFAVHGPPPGGPGQGLALHVSLGTKVRARVTPDGRGARLFDEHGVSSLSYGGLMVYDAAGYELPAWLVSGAGSLTINVDDRGARYPVVVDPWVRRTRLAPKPSAHPNSFGKAVDLNGDTLIIGDVCADSNCAGGAYVFVRVSGNWAQQAKLAASDGAAGDWFGFFVSVSGDTAIVGAPYDDGKVQDSGSAYVYVRNGTKWVQQAKLVPPMSASPQDIFGYSVSLQGNTAIIGAPGAGSAGLAYVYVRKGTTWSLETTLQPSTGGQWAYFGVAVSLDGNSALIGADGDYAYSYYGTPGAAYVFERGTSGWVQEARLQAQNPKPGDSFGSCVSVSGHTAAVGGSWQGFGVFLRIGGTWTRQTGVAGSWPVSASGSRVVVGPWPEIYVRSGASWSVETTLLLDKGDLVGNSAALEKDRVAVSARVGGTNSNGAVYIFDFLPPSQDGTACQQGADCKSGYCVDGVCCGSACGSGSTADCQACSKAAGAAKDGTCSVVAATTVCRASTGPCDVAEQCDGKSSTCPADATAPAGTMCDDGQACTSGDACDGKGTCAGTTYTCTPGECEQSSVCDGKGGCTTTNKPDGTSCSKGTCQSGTCQEASGGCNLAGGQASSLPLWVLLALATRRHRRRAARLPRDAATTTGPAPGPPRAVR